MKMKMNQFQEFESEGKTFKIYTWENKPFGDLILNLPENERLATFHEFGELIDERKFKMEKYKFYITKNILKSQWNKEYCLSSLYLNWTLYLNSYGEGLEYSNDNGRVVVVIKK
jgi:hypothetical protein